jgi:hypothetical protein
MVESERPAPEEIILYAKDPQTKIATITFDGDDLMLSDAIDSGLADTVKDNDVKFPPDFRLSKSGRAKQG